MKTIDKNEITKIIDNSADTANIKDEFNHLRHVREHGEHSGYSTGWKQFDDYFKFPPFGQLNVVTGCPGSGKSEWLDSLAIKMSLSYDWKIFVYSPENNPLSFHLKKMVEKSTGKPFHGHWKDCNGKDRPLVNKKDLDMAETVFNERFTFINCHLQGATIEKIINSIILTAITKKVNMVIIDPWNKIEHGCPVGMSETKYIGRCLARLQMLAREHNLSIWVVAHPAKPQKKKDGSFAATTLYDISGSAEFYNMTDNGFILTRNWNDKISDSNLTEMKIAKIKDRRYGKCGEMFFKFEPWCGRFTEPNERY